MRQRLIRTCFFISLSALLYVQMPSSASAIETELETKDWYAWIDMMPPEPNKLHVIGDVLVANPGVEADLYIEERESGNPKTLRLDLVLVQKPGNWIQVITWVQAKFDKVIIPKNKQYHEIKKIEIYSDNELIAEIPVETVH